jgi:hypothetical protein
MGKKANDLVMDAALDYVAACDRMFVCSAEPASYAEASATYDLATHTLTSGDFSKANGDSSGRKVTVAQQASIAVDHNGTATHIALGKSGSSELTYVTTCTSQVLTAGNTVTVPAFDIEFGDPT